MNKNMLLIKTQILVILIIAALINFGCNKPQNPKERGHQIFSFTPLTYEKYNNFMNNIDTFCIVAIVYRQTPNTSGEHKQFYLHAGGGGNNFTLSSFQVYDGSLSKRTINPIVDSFEDRQFDASEVQEIFNYLGANNTYFFDGSEYDGQNPLQTEYFWFCRKNYIFVLSFFDSQDASCAWSIQKCVDEYPAPEHPLYGLFQLLEEHFISQFEEP